MPTAQKTTSETIKKQIIFDDDVLEKIAGKTAQEVDGVLELKGGLLDKVSSQFNGDQPEHGVSADVDVDEETVELELEGILEYGRNANEIFEKVSRKIVAAISSMTGYRVTSIKLHVKDLLTAQEWQQQQADQSKSSKKDK